VKTTRVQIARFKKQPTAEQIAALKSKKETKELGDVLSLVHVFNLERAAENGPPAPAVFVWDELVKELIRAVHSGEMDIAAIPSPLLREFAGLVYRGHLDTLREIGNAVKRVHARATGLKPGETLTFEPKRPGRLKGIEQGTLSGTLATSGETVAIATGNAISSRTARRLNKKLGLKPGKAGRPPKTVGTKVKSKKRIRTTDTDLRAEIDKGMAHFFQKRPRPKSVWEKRKK
jgi:hypothetical protein